MDPVREVAEAVVNLGIANEVRIAPFVKALRQRPVTESTTDEEDEAQELLSALERARVIDAAQRETIEKMLRGDLTPRAAPQDKPDPFVGKNFGGWRALAKIGEGGMGSVYRAERSSDGTRDQVVKVLSPLISDGPTYVRFRREGEVMAALRHPNVVRVHAAGEVDDLSYIVMDFVDGPSLQEVLDRRTRFEWVNGAKTARQIALALEAAHSIGVIHRDVKPANVLISRTEGLVKVADFGLAKLHHQSSDPNVSRAGDILGSPSYIAPEQWGDHDVDPRADLFALGVVLYQLVAGVLPFRGRGPAELARRILAGTYDPVELYSPDCPVGLRQVIAFLLERRREYRYPTASQVVADLERILRSELPDVPRLVHAPETTRDVLLGQDLFTIGSAPDAHVRIVHPSVRPRHGVLERTPTGLLLRDLTGRDGPAGERTSAIRVNGMRIHEIQLKDQDLIEIGEAPPLRYRCGARVQPLGPSHPTPSPGTGGLSLVPRPGDDSTVALSPPVAVPGPVYEALLEQESPRAVVALIELLDEATWHQRTVRARRRLVSAGVDPTLVGRAVERAIGSYRRLALAAPDRLFRATRENLGPDPEPWLQWWFATGRERSPVQVRPPGPRAVGALALVSIPGETAASVVRLDGLERWTVGRGPECDVRLADRSVSRRHATLFRLLTRFAVQDEGSRFGTVLRGERRATSLLRHDDSIELGRAKVLFRQLDDRTESQDSGSLGIDALVFDALVALDSPHTLAALARLADRDAQLARLAVTRVPGQGDEDLAAVARAVLERRTRESVDALMRITGTRAPGADPDAWRRFLAEGPLAPGSERPVAVHPEGFGAAQG